MKKYFATTLHDSEEIARMHMPNSSRPVPVYLAADLKPDARHGRCACAWSGDSLVSVCFAHLEAVRAYIGDRCSCGNVLVDGLCAKCWPV